MEYNKLLMQSNFTMCTIGKSCGKCHKLRSKRLRKKLKIRKLQRLQIANLANSQRHVGMRFGISWRPDQTNLSLERLETSVVIIYEPIDIPRSRLLQYIIQQTSSIRAQSSELVSKLVRPAAAGGRGGGGETGCVYNEYCRKLT